jgi:hypothetical protein
MHRFLNTLSTRYSREEGAGRGVNTDHLVTDRKKISKRNMRKVWSVKQNQGNAVGEKPVDFPHLTRSSDT